MVGLKLIYTLEKMAAILHMTYPSAFPWKKMHLNFSSNFIAYLLIEAESEWYIYVSVS